MARMTGPPCLSTGTTASAPRLCGPERHRDERDRRRGLPQSGDYPERLVSGNDREGGGRRPRQRRGPVPRRWFGGTECLEVIGTTLSDGRHAGEPRFGALEHGRRDAQIVGAGLALEIVLLERLPVLVRTSRPAGSVRSPACRRLLGGSCGHCCYSPRPGIARGSAAWLGETGRADIRDRRSARGRHRLCLDLRKTAIESGPCLSAAIAAIASRTLSRSSDFNTRHSALGSLSSGSSGSSSSGVVRPCRPVGLQQDVVADGIDERPEAFRRGQAAFLLERGQHADERFLPRILDQRRRTKARAKLQGQQIAEIVGEMPLGFRIFGNQPLDVVAVEAEAWAK